MSDAPAHHLFCLLGSMDSSKKTLPEILVVIQVSIYLWRIKYISSFRRGKYISEGNNINNTKQKFLCKINA